MFKCVLNLKTFKTLTLMEHSENVFLHPGKRNGFVNLCAKVI